MRYLYITVMLALLTAGCTFVSADVNTGRIDVFTLMTSRQDVTISRDANGTVQWKAAKSDADSTIAEAALNVTKIAAKSVGVE